MPDSPRLSSHRVYTGRIVNLDIDEVRMPDGSVAELEMVRHPGASGVVPFMSDPAGANPSILLIKQYRYAADDRLWELPAGRIDSGEGELAAAKRELLEETGFIAAKWQRALHFYVSPGFLDETMSVYLARGLRRGKAQPEDDERITVRFFPLKQAVQMALSGKIADAKTIASILWLEIKLVGGAEPALS